MAAVGEFGPQSDDPTGQGLIRFGIQQKTAMVGVTISAIAGGLKVIEDMGADGFKVGVVPFPTLPGGEQHPVAGGNALTVLSKDKCQAEVATEFVVSMLAPDVVAASTEAFSYIPVDTEAVSSLGAFYERYPQLEQFNELADSLVGAPVWPGARGGELPTALSDQVVRIMTGADPAATLAAAQQQAEDPRPVTPASTGDALAELTAPLLGGPEAGVRIDVEHLCRSFGAVRALDDVSLVVAPGEIVALLGPSGSGKSTLLRICAGLEQPSSGELRFGGTSQLGLAPHQRDVSMVFQHFALYPHLSALDNLVLALRYGRRMSKGAARARAVETLEMLGIGALAGRKPAQMSGGQRQRVAIGRALATRAKVVLLDEPMSGLDAKLRVELRVEIVVVASPAGDDRPVRDPRPGRGDGGGGPGGGDNSGRVEQIGTPDEIYDRPATRFVASFVGSPPMNVCEGEWSDGVLRGTASRWPRPAGSVAVRGAAGTPAAGPADRSAPGPAGSGCPRGRRTRADG